MLKSFGLPLSMVVFDFQGPKMVQVYLIQDTIDKTIIIRILVEIIWVNMFVVFAAHDFYSYCQSVSVIRFFFFFLAIISRRLFFFSVKLKMRRKYLMFKTNDLFSPLGGFM